MVRASVIFSYIAAKAKIHPFYKQGRFAVIKNTKSRKVLYLRQILPRSHCFKNLFSVFCTEVGNPKTCIATYIY